MRHISFAWTTPALLVGRKTVTRRRWKERHARTFAAGDVVAVYDNDIRAGGRKVAEIELTQAPYRGGGFPTGDYEAEGFAYFEEHPEALPATAPDWMRGLTQEAYVAGALYDLETLAALWVVRFEVVGIEPSALRRR